MGFNLIGFDFFISDKLFGFWILSIRDYAKYHRNLLCVYYYDGHWILDLFFIRLLGENSDG